MNIVIVGTAYPLRGGIAHFNALLYKHLSKHHRVDIVTFSRQYPTILFPGKTQDEKGGQEGAVPSEQLIDSINPLTWIKAANAIARKKPDLLIFKYWMPFFGPCFGTIARLVRRKTGAKVLFICDNIIPHEKRPGDMVFTRYAFNAVDAFIVQSASVERDLNAFLPGSRYALVPHPVYEIFGSSLAKTDARAKLGIRDERVILFFGYVRRYKGLHTLLDAMPAILKSLKVKLLVVGEFYDDEQKYRQQIAENNLQNDVVVHSDYVPNEEVSLYFSAADVVVLPYITATQSGIVQIAYQFDKPVIATDVGGLAEVVLNNRTGFIVKPAAPQEVADAVVRFYEGKREQEFVKNVREEKKKYSWDNLIQAIEKLVHQSS
ncbi:MAG: glycosyl transferase group 1 [Bacteroidetes bacterium]|nr:glycosyl transferase group 1 [Bacteroidota bacterium]